MHGSDGAAKSAKSNCIDNTTDSNRQAKRDKRNRQPYQRQKYANRNQESILFSNVSNYQTLSFLPSFLSLFSLPL